MLCGNPDGRGVWGRMDTCICMSESLCYSPETVTTLLIGYTLIQSKKWREIKRIKKKQIHISIKTVFSFKNCPSYFMEMSSGYSLCKWHHSTRQEVSGPHAVLFPGWPSLRGLLVLGLWVSPSDPIATFTDVICPSYYCWITHHPKLSGVKWQALYYTHKFHELRIWKGHNRNGLSLLCDVWDLWENCE